MGYYTSACLTNKDDYCLNNLLLSVKDKAKLSPTQPPQTTDQRINRLTFKEGYSQEPNVLCFSAVHVGPLMTSPFWWQSCTDLPSSFASPGQ